MDTEELRDALIARERFAPDPEAVRSTVLAHPPLIGGRRRSGRHFAAIGIAAAVVLIAGTVSLVSSTPHGRPAAPDSHRPSITATTDPLTPALLGTYWSVRTVAKGPAGKPISVSLTDHFSLGFEAAGKLQIGPACGGETVGWATAGTTLTVDRLTLPLKSCPADAGSSPGAAAAAPAEAYQAMSTGQTIGHLDGKSLVLQAGLYTLVFRHDWTLPQLADPQPGSIAAAAQQWATFPTGARPRPVVMMSSAIVLPTDPLPDGQAENALDAGRITLSTTPPANPAVRGGYPLLTAKEAIAQLTDPHAADPSASFVHITNVQLTDHSWFTDRGDTSLPAWRVTLAESREPVYVLAVAAAGRYPATLNDNPAVGEMASVSADGQQITIPFIAKHSSTGKCDPDYTSTLTSKETPSAVVVAVTFHFKPPFPQPGCTDGFWAVAGISNDTNSATIHLRQPLGNRVVVNQLGTPYTLTRQ